MKNSMYLVTGAAGFLGGTVCRQLIARGDQVRSICATCGSLCTAVSWLWKRAQRRMLYPRQQGSAI